MKTSSERIAAIFLILVSIIITIVLLWGLGLCNWEGPGYTTSACVARGGWLFVIPILIIVYSVYVLKKHPVK